MKIREEGGGGTKRDLMGRICQGGVEKEKRRETGEKQGSTPKIQDIQTTPCGTDARSGPRIDLQCVPGARQDGARGVQ